MLYIERIIALTEGINPVFSTQAKYKQLEHYTTSYILLT